MQESVEYVREQIAKKLDYDTPYYAHSHTVQGAVTDMDHFPYTRFYRGNYTSNQPIIFDREAGYRLPENELYIPPEKEGKFVKPTRAFQVPCSTVFPKRTFHEDKYMRNRYKTVYVSP